MGDVMTFPKSVDEFMEQYKLIDEDHVYSNGTAFVPIFRMKQWFDHLQALPITNAERIRSMTDEELAVFLGNTKAFCCRDRDPSEEFTAEFKTWLKQEATDGT